MAKAMNAGDMMNGSVTEGAGGGAKMTYDKPDASAAKKLQRLEVEVHDNGGFTVKEYFKPSKGKRGMYDMAADSKSHAVKTPEELHQVLCSSLGMDCGEPEPDEDDTDAAGMSDTGEDGAEADVD